jgi:hypothetical protein
MLAVHTFVLALASAAAAQTPEPTVPPPGHNYLMDNHGPEASLNMGVGGFTNGSSAAFSNQPNPGDHLYGAGFGAEFTFGGRITPWLSVGAALHWQISPAQDLPQGTTGGVANSVATGPYARVYFGSAFHWRYWEPTLGVGVQPASYLWADHSTPSGNLQTRITAVAVPVQVGLEYNINRVVAAGVLFEGSPWISTERCGSTQPGGPLLCTGNNYATNVYLYGAANVRVQLPW